MYIHIHTRTTTVLHRRLKQMYWIIHFQVTFRLTPNRSPAPFTNRLCVFTSVCLSRRGHVVTHTNTHTRLCCSLRSHHQLNVFKYSHLR